MLPEDRPPPWVATRVGVVLVQDGLSLGGGQRWSVSRVGHVVHGKFLAP
ncbi:hypothetical protein Hgul01_05369 [Herpetosiphon gulosus]|uniref:Uncharacterized protein n=1 Tax=Herpetosiphon gulosus TaxID=1973496 RepID=A0ABP9X849_9CHLR